MTSTIITKNSSTASAAPLAADLTQGELAVNVTDKKLYSKDSGGAVVKLVGGLGNQEANAVAITGGTVNGTTLGATTAATASVTTLTTSSTVTHNGGTANGVTYLNGSKVLTSGSALTFDGTFLNANGLRLSGSDASNTIYKGSGALGITCDGPSIDIGANNASGYTTFSIASSERMRLTSTGLGIGTSSPSNKLQVSASFSGTSDLQTISRFDRVSSGTAANGLGGRLEFSSQDNAGSQRTAAWLNWKLADVSSGAPKGYLSLGSRGTAEALIIDDSGNLGLGVTPSASTITSLQVKQGSIANGSNNNTFLLSNAFNGSGGWTYIGSDTASMYQQAAGQHRFYTTASGTAGNAITFTQALTLTAGGDLCVGATSSVSTRLFTKGADTSSSNFAFRAYDSADTNLFFIRNDGYTQTGGGANSPYNLTTASAANLWVGSNGELRRSTSSLKYKTDVQDATHGLAEVLALRPVTYKGKNDGDTVFGGLIAEEVHEAGLTEFVQYAEDGTPDALAYGQMVSLCIKAIQELKAEFDAYKVAHP